MLSRRTSLLAVPAQLATGCWQPLVKNLTIQINSIYNGWRFEDIWLDR